MNAGVYAGSVTVIGGWMELVERGRQLRHIEDAMQRAISGCGGTTVSEGDAGGIDVAAQCRADALAERARAELIVAGARPRRGRITGPSALTASEHRVASLASTGLSNREIAPRLFVSRALDG